MKNKPSIIRKNFYKFLFLDLDGTIRKPKSLGELIQSPYDQEPIPGAKEMITSYKEERWIIIGVTNQGGVERGYKTIESCIAEQRQTLKLFPEMKEILFCPDRAGRECFQVRLNYPLATFPIEYVYACNATNFRKPGWGMIALTKQIYGIEKGHNFLALMVGDREEDKECAIGAEVDFMWAKDWREGLRTYAYYSSTNA